MAKDKEKILCIGIDPGWKSFGISVNLDGKVLGSNNHNPSLCDTIPKYVNGPMISYIRGVLSKADEYDKIVVFVERFVSYDGVLSSASEMILMMIGAVVQLFSDRGYEVHLVRAIDWKTAICKWLVKDRNFVNPYSNFDKKFSKLVASELSGNTSKISDHEADAICLSYLGGML